MHIHIYPIYIHISVHTYIYIYIYLYLVTHTYIYVDIHIYMHRLLHTYIPSSKVLHAYAIHSLVMVLCYLIQDIFLLFCHIYDLRYQAPCYSLHIVEAW